MRPHMMQTPKGRPLPSGAPREFPRTEAWVAREAPRGPTSALPSWESFPSPDRLQLVGLLIQTARRQVQPRLTGRPKTEEG